MKTIKTYLPVFSGFYNTIWESDETDFCYENDCTYDDLIVDYKQYKFDVVQEVIKWVKDNCEFITAIKFEKICSPKEYNFANDSVNVTITIKPKELKAYLKANKEALNTYLKQRYTSYDGFMSSYGNSFEAWHEETNNFVNLDNHYLGSLLDFYFENEDIEVLDCYYKAMENIYIDNYITFREKTI
jgi:hypothetical protein